MELFERLNLLAGKTGNKTKLAAALGIPQPKMSAWGNKLSQRNFWEYLPNLLEAMPDLSREWLYFEEGEMFRRSGDMSSNTEASHAAVLENQAETIRTLTETNRRLTEELLALRRSL